MIRTGVKGGALTRLLLGWCILAALTTALPGASPGRLRCEYLQDPVGIDVNKPRLSWWFNSTQRGDGQTAYQVLVAASATALDQNQGALWDSGKVASDQSVLVEYAGQPLTSGQVCYWKVRVWDREGNASEWSAPAQWSMGLLNAADWTAKWIGMATAAISPAAPSPMLRKSFVVNKPVARATAYICGLGYYELLLNGAKVGDHVLDPTWTRYDLQADYVTYEVAPNLVQGTNAIGVQLANGFYNQWSTDAWNTYNAPWRALPQLLLQLDIQYTDGTSQRVISDTTWKAATGPLLLDAARLGEVYDARKEKPGWATDAYDDAAWAAAIQREGIKGALIAPNAEPIKVIKTVYPVKIIPVSGQPGVYTFDFGQNLAGWGRLTVSGPAGSTVKMVFGEKTNSNGSVNQANINVHVYSQRAYFQTDTYILKGGGVETWEPRFTYHGFRYAQVQGLSAAPTTNTLVARVLNTDLEPAGSFLCSSDLLNRIETNTLWSFLGNFVGIPTDCPHREKNGWTGDAQLACEMGLTHFHSAAAFTRWIREFRPAQLPNGKLAGVFPNPIWSYDNLDGPAWESAYLLIPWWIYQHCGDSRILTNNYAGMKAYVDYCTSVASGNIVSYGLGDWCPASTTTPASVTGTAYYYQDACILAQTAALMGRTAESSQYSNLAARIKTSFNTSFFNPSTKLYAGGTQTAQSCALYQGLVDSSQIPPVAHALAATVRQGGNTIDTGILGSKYLLRALCDSGHADTALALATQTAYPSWGYWVTNGATTLWETWNGTGDIDSLNHIMFGDISAWFIQYLAGIRPGSPGYKSIIIKPEIMSPVTWAQATHESPYGRIASAWQVTGQQVTLNLTIPPGTTAAVYLPTPGTALADLVIREGATIIWEKGAPAGAVPWVEFDHSEGVAPQTHSVWRVASGCYQFSWNIWPPPGGLSIHSGNHWVSLRWNAAPGATSYRVKRAAVSGGPYTALTNVVLSPSFTDTTVANGATWYYVISALSPAGESPDSAEVSATPNALLNPGFETPRIGTYQYNVPGAGWTFSGATPNGSGITANGSGFTSYNAPAPEGSQVAFVQQYGTMSQTLVGFTPGSNYTLTFSAAQRRGPDQHGGESWNVKIDNRVIGAYNPGPNATNFVDYALTFTASALSHTLTFVGTNLAGGDNTVFIDNVRLKPDLEPVFASVTLTSPTNTARFTAPASLTLAATVTTNGNTINCVQFYSNATNLIAQVAKPPYTSNWTNVGSGDYSLFSRVVFNGGCIVDSPIANISIANPPPVFSGMSLDSGGGTFSLWGSGQSGQVYILNAASNLAAPVLWTPILTNQSDANGAVGFTNLPLTNAQQFYRISKP